jgi:hypothetical protein
MWLSGNNFSYAKFVIAITFITSIREHSEPVRKTGPTPGPTSLSLGRRSYSAAAAIFIARQTMRLGSVSFASGFGAIFILRDATA